MLGIAYAVISMVFAGVNDFLFKEASDRARQALGWFLAGVGLIWTLVFSIGLFFTGAPHFGGGWPISVGSGLVSILANILFLYSYRFFPASAGATIYRLNLVVVAILCVFWLDEPMTLIKGAGILLGAVAVVALQMKRSETTRTRAAWAGLGMLALACVLRALMGVLYKVAANQGIPYNELLAINGACWLVGGLVFALGSRQPLPRELPIWRTAAVSGLLVCGIVFFMFAATQQTQASIAIPITQMGFILTSVLGITFHGEAITIHKTSAMLAAIMAILLLTHG